ncbi:MAG: hypothetical protein HC794_00485 [Nitrospiraceae bacterium]|nr:hypothetical protein [Nitrospiraceae bacterium]
MKPSALTKSTKAIYERHARTVARLARQELGKEKISLTELAAWFVSQDGRWKANTINAYRRALIVKAEEIYGPDKAEEIAQLLRAGPRPHGLKGRTTDGKPTKRKDITAAEWQRFADAARNTNTDWDTFILDFIKFGLLIPSRPIELGSMHLADDTLWIQTAKANKTRGLNCATPAATIAQIVSSQVSRPEGMKFRSFDLRLVNSDDRQMVERICTYLPDWVREKGGWRKFYDALRARCRVLSAHAQIFPAISPASVRHLSISAIKKAHGTAAAAAAAGHATTKASANNYKRASSKSLEVSHAHQIEPDAKVIAKVTANPRAMHPRLREKKAPNHNTGDLPGLPPLATPKLALQDVKSQSKATQPIHQPNQQQNQTKFWIAVYQAKGRPDLGPQAGRAMTRADDIGGAAPYDEESEMLRPKRP